MHRGYVKAHRRLFHSDLWLSEPFTRGQAWMDLIGLANHAPREIRKRGVLVKVERGTVGYSEVALAERWQWSRGKVRRFLKWLETVQQIEQQKNNVTTCICIVNYDTYQGDGTAERTPNGTANGHQTVQEQEVKEVKALEEKPKRTPRANGARIVCPEDVEEKTWADFLTLRKAKKAPITDTALARIRSEAGKAGITLEAALVECCARGWQGFKADWYSGEEDAPRTASPELQKDLDRLVRENPFVAAAKGLI